MDGEIREEVNSPQTLSQQSQLNSPQDSQSTGTGVSISRVNFVPNQSVSSNNTAVDVEVLEVRNDAGQREANGENKRLRRKWEYFPGKNRFYCDGRVMTAPSIRFCLLSFALILLTFTLFIIYDAPFLTERLTVAFPIVGSLLFVTVIVNMVKTSFSDPGILPRASQQEADYLEKSYYSTNFRPPPRTKDIVVNGQVIKSKYCFTCKMFRPPRASHCGVCDNCVDRFDHHCPFLGNCIGKRNYRSFYTFIVSLSFLAVFVLSASIAHLAMLSKERANFLEALRDSPSSAIVILISFFGMWTVIGLTGFHTYLIAVEQTTNEDIKGLFGRANAKNPFSHGNFCQNCCFVLCGPSQPSLIDPRGFASPEFVAALPKKSDPNGMLSPSKAPQLTIKTGPTNNITNENQGHQQANGGSFPGTNKIFREQPPSAQTVQPIQHQPIQFASPGPSMPPEGNGGIHPPKPTFSELPAIPPEEKVLLKGQGQTRNGRVDYRQTIPEISTHEAEVQMSQQDALISPSAASTVSLSTLSTSNLSSNNDYDTVGSPGTRVGRVPVPNLASLGSSSSSVRNFPTRNSRSISNSKRLFPSSSADQLDEVIDPSDFDDDLDMPSLSNINEIEIVRRTNNGRMKPGGNVNKAGLSSGMTKSTRSLPSTSLADNNANGGDINKIHVLESSYPGSSKSSVSGKFPSGGGGGVKNKLGNANGSSGPGRGAKSNNNKRNLNSSTMQNSPLHLDTIM